jgi:hypothetical protein
MTNNIPEEEKILRRIPLEILILSFVMALGSIFLFKPLTAVFVLAGGAFSALSFIWLKTSISTFLLKNGGSPSKKKALRSALLLYGIRLLLIIAIFFIIIFFFSRNIIAFVAGFSAIIPVFLAEAVLALTRMKQWKS